MIFSLKALFPVVANSSNSNRVHIWIFGNIKSVVRSLVIINLHQNKQTSINLLPVMASEAMERVCKTS